jgi:deoxyribodipyrimidine photo-lyase
VDADLANNTLGWQWTAGCGADAAPFFRIFNPVLQGEKFDPEGRYVRRWVPELSQVPNAYLHHPWDLPLHHEAKAELMSNYPQPLVDLSLSRLQALEAFKAIK